MKKYCKECKKEMIRAAEEEKKYYIKEYRCSCGVSLSIVEDYDEYDETDLYTWCKDGNIIECEEVFY